MYWWSSVKTSRAPSGTSSGDFSSKTATCDFCCCGEMAQPAVSSPFNDASTGNLFCEKSAFAFANSSSFPSNWLGTNSFTPNLVSTKLPSFERPAPFFGSGSSIASSRKPVRRLSASLASTV